MTECRGTKGTNGSGRRLSRGVAALCSSLALIIATVGLTAATADAGTNPAATAQRPRPTTTPRPTASPSASPTPSPTAAPVSCPSAVVFEGATYCPGYVNLIKSSAYGVGQRIVVNVVVDRVSGLRVDVHGAPWCAPGNYCGALFASMSVTFASGASVPAYGNIIRLFGITTQGGLSPTGFIVTGQCDPYWGDC